jgi:hypothetical protein
LISFLRHAPVWFFPFVSHEFHTEHSLGLVLIVGAATQSQVFHGRLASSGHGNCVIELEEPA